MSPNQRGCQRMKALSLSKRLLKGCSSFFVRPRFKDCWNIPCGAASSNASACCHLVLKKLSIDLIKLLVYNRVMDIFTALVEPTIRTIVEMLARSGPLSATEISEQFPVSPPAISQHLKVLREANVVHREKRAQQRLYRLNPDALFELEGWARYMTHLWNQRFDALEREHQEKAFAQAGRDPRSHVEAGGSGLWPAATRAPV